MKAREILKQLNSVDVETNDTSTHLVTICSDFEEVAVDVTISVEYWGNKPRRYAITDHSIDAVWFEGSEITLTEEELDILHKNILKYINL